MVPTSSALADPGTVEWMNAAGGVRRVGAAAVLVAAGIAALVTGCSNRNAPQAGEPHSGNVRVTAGAGGVQAITLSGGDNLRFNPSTFHVHPGKVKITLRDSGTTPHEFSFTGKLHLAIPMTMHGQSNSIQFTVHTPGRYPFVCDLHVRENMTGTMIVDP
jgi:plastocyanin